MYYVCREEKEDRMEGWLDGAVRFREAGPIREASRAGGGSVVGAGGTAWRFRRQVGYRGMGT